MKSERIKFYVEKQSRLVQSAVVLMILSAVFRLLGCWNRFGDSFFAVTQIALPLACNLLFILLLMTVGKRFFSLTLIPVALGVAFFIFQAIGFDSWLHTLLSILLYVLVLVAYGATVWGRIPSKWPLVPLFALPLLYQVLVVDVKKFTDPVQPMSFAEGMQEMSVLCILLALILTALAMKKKKPRSLEEAELPKIKDPKLIVPAAQAAGEGQADPEISDTEETAEP